jgi:murein DD-endopeptidase MepM/ murein hydrolase activator NlpD
MEKKNGFTEKLDSFFAGKGFYIVLFLCVAIIGVSAWIMFGGETANVDDGNGTSISAGNDVGATAPVLSGDDGGNAAYPDDSMDTMQDVELQPEPEPEPPVINVEEPVSVPTVAEAPAYVWPLSGEIERPYSADKLIYDKTMADWRTHAALDIAAEAGTQVMAAGSGRIDAVYQDDLLGTTVIIDHGNRLKSVYSNLAVTPTVNAGDSVTTGAIIGSVGDTAKGETGEATHLHFAMAFDGAPVNPADYLP